MTKVRIELSDATARAVRGAGLLTSEVLERLLRDAIRRRQAADELLTIAERVAGVGIASMGQSAPMASQDHHCRCRSIHSKSFALDSSCPCRSGRGDHPHQGLECCHSRARPAPNIIEGRSAAPRQNCRRARY